MSQWSLEGPAPPGFHEAMQSIVVAFVRVEPRRHDPYEVLPARVGGVTRFVRRDEVRYAEAHGDYARLHTPSGSHLVRISLAALEEAWRDAGFVRIHRSHLVALAHVEELAVEAGRCTLRVGGARLTVSRRNTGALRDRLLRARTARAARPDSRQDGRRDNRRG